MLERIQEIIREYKGDSTIEITAGTNIYTELGLPSIDYFSLIMEVEDSFGVKIPDSKLTEFRTVGDIIDYINSKK